MYFPCFMTVGSGPPDIVGLVYAKMYIVTFSTDGQIDGQTALCITYVKCYCNAKPPNNWISISPSICKNVKKESVCGTYCRLFHSLCVILKARILMKKKKSRNLYTLNHNSAWVDLCGEISAGNKIPIILKHIFLMYHQVTVH